MNLEFIEIDDSEYVLNGEPYETYPTHMELELLEEFDDEKYALDVLKNRGMKGNIQGARRANGLVD